MDSIAVLIKEPDTDQLVVLMPNCSMGAAPRENGEIMVKLTDLDTGVPIMASFDPENFKDVVENFQAALGTRLVEVSDAEVKEFGRGTEGPQADRALRATRGA